MTATADKIATINPSPNSEHVEYQVNSEVGITSGEDYMVKSPLAHLSVNDIISDVQIFAENNDLSHITSLLTRGALVAKDPSFFDRVPGLTEVEIHALRNENLHRWRQPKALYLTVMLCSIGAAVQGWDQTGSNGANLSFPDALGIPVDEYISGTSLPNPNANRNQWLQGLINAGPYISASLIGCWLSDPTNYFLGRRGAIFISAILCCLSVIGSAVSQNWWELLLTRFLLGIGMGMKASVIPVFCAETIPTPIRGGLVMSWQLWTTFGVFLGTCANLAFKDVGTISWRLQFGSAFLPAVPLVIGIYFCPESPRWYIKKGKISKAYGALKRLRNTELQAARDLYYIFSQMRFEKKLEAKAKNCYLTRFIELFTIPRLRRATLASFTVMIAQQLCGINIISFYSATIFSKAGSSATIALLATCGFGLIEFAFAWIAVFTIDTYGRRSLLLCTFPQMFWTLLAAGACFWIPEENRAHLGLIITFIYIFAAFYATGEGPVPYTYSAEAFPLSHREVGMSWAVSTTAFWAPVLSICFPRMLAVFTSQGAFGFFAGLNLLTFCMIFLWVPETKGRTLEELDFVFSVSTRRFMHHQCFRVLPWWIKRYVLRQKATQCPSLIILDTHVTPNGAKSDTVLQD